MFLRLIPTLFAFLMVACTVGYAPTAAPTETVEETETAPAEPTAAETVADAEPAQAPSESASCQLIQASRADRRGEAARRGDS